ncbi:hypothetical protein J2X48_004621 [Bosea sp. BE271]|uniref:hypothetical protein n=1 Tax=Bosea sp. BE168 TaxID=2817907 RepID=UPI00285AFAEB|nr:hypothetical protein [Bosea sp. BE168]MDR7141016.1 hypothetical protein [Bosea sp. BE168]MDR7177674.1 hypothetical protein [Bosea sp. BE271]
MEIREGAFGTFETNVSDHERVITRRRTQIEQFVAALGDGPIYLDITGLGHATWAPLVKVCIETNRTFRAIYLEPETYNESPSAEVGQIFDLSERIDGIAPLPLFASLDDRPDEEICFVPLLGFEGVRFSHMLNEVQPRANKIYPIIGVPGFRPHYPLDAYLGNSSPLEKYKATRNMNFAKSNCPFSLYYTLGQIRSRFPNEQMKIGLIGTKPHALGAIIFAIAHADSVELVYDNVKRKDGRTKGTARYHVYGVSDFLPPSRRGGS